MGLNTMTQVLHNKKSYLCSVKGCEKLAKRGRGWCSSHYMRWSRYGDPNIKKRQGYENHGLRILPEYEIWATYSQQNRNKRPRGTV